LLFAAFAAAGCQQAPAPPAAPTQEEIVARGEYLVTIVGCNDCHTPLKMGANGPEPDMTRMLSGHPETLELPPPPRLPAQGWNWGGAETLTAFAGPWGITYAINLTPDENTGIGTWTEEMFVNTIRNGRHMGGEARPIQPPMPWPWYAKMTDDDLKAIYAYLRTIPPIVNRVPEYQEPPAPN
jgi:mono/diheme cytochrome c family protein